MTERVEGPRAAAKAEVGRAVVMAWNKEVKAEAAREVEWGEDREGARGAAATAAAATVVTAEGSEAAVTREEEARAAGRVVERAGLEVVEAEVMVEEGDRAVEMEAEATEVVMAVAKEKWEAVGGLEAAMGVEGLAGEGTAGEMAEAEMAEAERVAEVKGVEKGEEAREEVRVGEETEVVMVVVVMVAAMVVVAMVVATAVAQAEVERVVVRAVGGMVAGMVVVGKVEGGYLVGEAKEGAEETVAVQGGGHSAEWMEEAMVVVVRAVAVKVVVAMAEGKVGYLAVATVAGAVVEVKEAGARVEELVAGLAVELVAGMAAGSGGCLVATAEVDKAAQVVRVEGSRVELRVASTVASTEVVATVVVEGEEAWVVAKEAREMG